MVILRVLGSCTLQSFFFFSFWFLSSLSLSVDMLCPIHVASLTRRPCGHLGKRPSAVEDDRAPKRRGRRVSNCYSRKNAEICTVKHFASWSMQSRKSSGCRIDLHPSTIHPRSHLGGIEHSCSRFNVHPGELTPDESHRIHTAFQANAVTDNLVASANRRASLLLVAMPGAPSSVLVPSSKARSP